MNNSREIVQKLDEILELAGKPKLTPTLEKVFAGVPTNSDMSNVLQSVYDEVAGGVASGVERFQVELEKTLGDKDAMNELVQGVKNEINK